MLISSLPRRKIICGVNPPRAEIQRRTGDGYIEYSVCVAAGLVTSGRHGEVPRRVETQIGARRHANLVVRNRAENDGARRGAQAVDDDCLARSPQALIFVEVSADLAAAIISNPDDGVGRAHSCKKDSRRQQNRRKFHVPPRSKPNRI